ncbi:MULTISPECIES: hypothetical protein [Nostoc]|uniref:Uncharacterized protein n=1 Tax=Nostoc paludosum FACHB-159 TaxID=2692908 RepID=A0ABR8KD22_9NOSO|nr:MULTISPECIES: hypothetical protein [Nostoc]MBD2680366.1 hypothetical protein [Nostoc sp. FACHB-857]MBD2736754.1 hypothetical protein [Nostoc paludosum FACHB-159]
MPYPVEDLSLELIQGRFDAKMYRDFNDSDSPDLASKVKELSFSLAFSLFWQLTGDRNA